MKKTLIFIVVLSMTISLTSCTEVAQVDKPRKEPVKWEHLSTENGDLQVPFKGDQQTASLVLDIDKDGRDDFVVTERTGSPSVVWYRSTKQGFKKYIIDNDKLRIEAGGTKLDIDKDGDIDIVFAGDARSNEIWWWENPYPNYDQQTVWQRRIIKNSGPNKHHDQMFGDVDDDGKMELITWNQKGKVFWLIDIPDDPKGHKGQWPKQLIMKIPNDKYEGLDIADIDLDGQMDIVGAARWFKHIEGSRFQEFVIDKDPTRVFTRCAAGQLIPGGRPEVVIVPGDDNGHLSWYQWTGDGWAENQIKEMVIHGHSLQIADINLDGHLDIFCAEMGDPGHKEKATAWVFYGDSRGNFVEDVISTGYANHESKLGDFDGDGDSDLLTKPYHYKSPRLDIFINQAK